MFAVEEVPVGPAQGEGDRGPPGAVSFSFELQHPGSTSQNTTGPPHRGHGRAPVELPGRYVAVLDAYSLALTSALLMVQTRRTYTSKARQYLAWLAGTEVDGNPVDHTAHRDLSSIDHLAERFERGPAQLAGRLVAVVSLSGLGRATPDGVVHAWG